MTVSVAMQDGIHKVHIDGTIKSVTDSQSIKDAVLSCVAKKDGGSAQSPIRILITNSFSVTSSVIGFLLKQVQADKIDIAIQVSDERLFDLFKSLNLSEVLRVTKYESD